MSLALAARAWAAPAARASAGPSSLASVSAGVMRAGPSRSQAGVRASSGGGGGGVPQRPNAERTQVTFRVPGGSTRRFTRLTQACLTDWLKLKGAEGFVTADGGLSRRLDDLTDGGTVDVVLNDVSPVETQVRPWLACQPAGQRQTCVPNQAH